MCLDLYVEQWTTRSLFTINNKQPLWQDSDSSSDIEDVLPENTLEVEKSLQASAIKNNLDDASVKKILKKVVTNDHVLALVKLREEEESSNAAPVNLQPKLTRAKVKELMKVSPKTAPWNIELTPIKHIPVKTRPEVEALITKELPEDEDDDEYHPTQDDVPSDDDQTLESCSDLDSQPRTPATPSDSHASPSILRDGPFKVPLGISTPARRKLKLEEEATIALRTRSKLSLSSTSIEHIESSFVPPDEVPTPVVDDLWNQFLEQCLNPAEVSKHEDDDEADPEYNVAADPDAHDEDEEALENSIIKISKKELNDLVTELFSIMPEVNEEQLAENLATNVLTSKAGSEVPSHWDGKQEPISDEEAENKENQIRAKKISPMKRDSAIRFSIGKSEPEDTEYNDGDYVIQVTEEREQTVTINTLPPPRVVTMSVHEQPACSPRRASPPPPLQRVLHTDATPVRVEVDSGVIVLPEQIQILQQQLRQHIQLAASNFLQLYVNPVHWSLAPTYKEYLEQFNNMLEKDPTSVVNVCNLKPALDLVDSWERSVSEDTPENKKMVEYIQEQTERSRRRFKQNSLYVGNFHELFLETVANSGVFLYPYLLPAMPYHADSHRKFSYRRSEDELIALGLEQFWQYIEDNPDLFKRPNLSERRPRWGLAAASELVCKHMLPWFTPRWLQSHISRVKKEKDNPLYKFFQNREITPVKHTLLPYNPSLTLYEQPEHEMPRIWIRYLAKSSKRFRDHLYKRKYSGAPPTGVPVNNSFKEPTKNPLPIDFTKPIVCSRVYNDPEEFVEENKSDKFDVKIVKDANTDANVTAITPCNLVAANEIWSIGNSAGNMMRAVKFVANNNTSESNKDKTTTETISANATSNITATTKSITGPVLSINAGVIEIGPTIVGNNTTNNRETVSTTKDAKTGIDNDKTCAENVTKSKEANDKMDVDSNVNTTDNLKANTEQNTTTQAENNYTLPPNMYKIVQTSLGSYLVPLTVQTTSVNSINTPISSIAQKSTVIRNDLPEATKNPVLTDIMKQADRLKNHCQCCILLKKICKAKQSLITDFFNPKKTENKCECSHRKYPRISSRLRLLVNNYKSRSLCEQRNLEAMMEAAKTEGNKNKECERETESDVNSRLNDIAYVTTFQTKLTIRAALVRYVYTKKKINTLFSKFNPECDDPMLLTRNLYKALEVELVDLYKEFMGFLTAEQADKIDKFKDYFLNRCMGDLLKRIEIEIPDANKRWTVLSYLKSIYTDNISSSCQICTRILVLIMDYPQLAKYVFSLFPHRVGKKEQDSCNSRTPQPTPKDPTPTPSEPPTHTPTELTQPEQNEKETSSPSETVVKPADETLTVDDKHRAVDCEADQMSCDEERDGNNAEAKSQIPGSLSSNTRSFKCFETKSENVFESEELTISKTEVQDYSESTTMSPLVMSEDEPLKSEALEWNRDEDKIMLKALLDHLSPQERQDDKTILEILEEKNVYQMLSDSLPHKSIDAVRERILYLIEILVLSEY